MSKATITFAAAFRQARTVELNIRIGTAEHAIMISKAALRRSSAYQTLRNSPPGELGTDVGASIPAYGQVIETEGLPTHVLWWVCGGEMRIWA